MSSKLKIKVLYPPVSRKYNYSTHVGTEDGVKELFFPELFKDKLQSGKSFILLNSLNSDKDILQIKQNISKVFECETFEINEQKVEEFIRPKVVSLADAILCSGTKRVSLEGYIFDLQDTEGDGHKRKRTMKLAEDKSHDVAISVKLWGSQSELPLRTGVRVKIENVIVKKYKEENEANSTPLTNIEVSEVAQVKNAAILGINWERPICSIFCDDDAILKIPDHKLEEFYGSYGAISRPNQKLDITIIGDDVQTITTAEPKNKKND